MIKRLTKHGNSQALVLDKAVLELLRIDAATPLEITTDGKSLTITPVAEKREKLFAMALADANKRHGKALKDLASK